MPSTACSAAAYTPVSSAIVRCTVIAEEGGPGPAGPLGGGEETDSAARAAVATGAAVATVAAVAAVAVVAAAAVAVAAVAPCPVLRFCGLLAISHVSRNTPKLHGEGDSLRLSITLVRVLVLFRSFGVGT